MNSDIPKYCNCPNYAVLGMRKYHPTEKNSLLIGRPVPDICLYCGKEKQPYN